jgi:heptose I phosphotransferase
LRRGAVWSIARREWENGRALENAGLRVAGRVAYGEDCGPFWEKFSFIITEAASGQTLEQFLGDSRDRALRRRVLDRLAPFVRRLHEAGLASPDLFTRHIFVETADNEPRFCLIDMARLDRRKTLSARLRARDLAALNVTAPPGMVSPRERVRFLRSYCGGRDKELFRLIRSRMAHLLKRRKHRVAWSSPTTKNPFVD